jgi:hypothetical protein
MSKNSSILNFAHIPLKEMDADERHYMIEYTDSVAKEFIESSNKNYATANSTEQSLSNQLILLNTVLLTGSLLSFNNDTFFSSISLPQSILIFSIFTLQALSISFAVLDYKLRQSFFAQGGDETTSSATYIKARKYLTVNEMLETLAKNDKKFLKKSNRFTSKAQVYLLLASLFLFVVLIYSLLFDVPLYRN